MDIQKSTGFPSIDKPWLKFYDSGIQMTELPKCTLYEYLWQCNSPHLNDIAINYFSAKISYMELFGRIEAAASKLSDMGVKEGDIITLMMLNTPEAGIFLYALNYIGAVADFIYFSTDEETIINEIKSNGSKIFISQEIPLNYDQICMAATVEKCILVPAYLSMPKLMQYVGKLKNKRVRKKSDYILYWDQFQVGIEKAKILPAKYKKDTPAVIVHTGGTTGNPKGVLLSNENLNSCVYQTLVANMGWIRGKTMIHTIPPFVAYGIAIGIHMALCNGMVSIMIPNPDPSQAGKLIRKYHPYAMVGGAPHVESILSDRKIRDEDLSNLKILIVGGESLSPERERYANSFLVSHHSSAVVQTGYGMTETCSAVCVNMNQNRTRFGTLGIPFSHSVIAIFDPDTGEECTYNEEGEICIASPNNMLGYFNRPEETAMLIRKHHGNTWVHSGDIGSIDLDGFVHFKGRIKRIFMTKDVTDGSVYKLFPTYIENIIMQIPEVVNCCVICQPEESRYNIAIAYVQPVFMNPAMQELEEKIYIHCEQILPKYSLPTRIIFIKEIPLTPIGKKDYRALETQLSK